MKTIALVWVAAAACGGAANPKPAAPEKPVAPGDPPAAAAQAVDLDLEPNGMVWDAAGGRLVISDERGNRLAAWTPAGGVTTVATLPAPPADTNPGLGQPAQMADGSWLVPRFGDGHAGTIWKVDRDGKASELGGLDPARRRIGVTVGPTGVAYEAWFVKTKGAAEGPHGGVSALGVDGYEQDVVTTLGKPVGLLALDHQLIVSDQAANALLVIALGPDPAAATPRAQLDAPDLIVAGPNGSVLVSQKSGGAVEIAPDGKRIDVVHGLRELRGIAFDPKTRRVFLAQRPADKGGKATLAIVTLP